MGSNYELDQGDEFIFAIDVSGSMQTADVGGMKRIDALKEQVISFIKEASKYDPDGIDLLTFGQDIKHVNGGPITAEAAEKVVNSLKATEASTDTAGVIRKAYELFTAKKSDNNTVLFVATDGAPNDKNKVKEELRRIAKLQDAGNENFSVSFLTVGVIDAKLEEFLNELDDDLKAVDKSGNPIDIVDRKALADVDFVQAFAGAIND